MKMNKHFTKKLLSILLCLALIMGCLPSNVFAVETGLPSIYDDQVTEDSKSLLYYSADTSITLDMVYEERYNLWIGGVEVTSNKTSGEGWSYDQTTNTLTLNGATITGGYDGGNPDHSAGIYATEALYIVLTGNNAISGSNCGIYAGNALNISGGGSLTATGNYDGIKAAGDITISGGTVTANGTSSYGICAEGKVISITGGYVTVNGGNSGSGIFANTVVLGSSSHLKVTHSSAAVAGTLSATGGMCRTSASGAFTETIAASGAYFEYLGANHVTYTKKDAQNHTVACTHGISFDATHEYENGACVCTAEDPMYGCDFIVTGDTANYSWDKTNKVLTINGGNVTVSNKDKNTATSHRIYIQGTANVTLDGVNISTTTGAPIEIRDYNDTNVTLTLSGSNTLISQKANKAAIHKTRGQQGDNSAAATLTINGSGSLTAVGGSNAAGIGGGDYRGDTHNIIINSGTISATGKGWAAGIGSSNDGSTWNIAINGGNVTANGMPGIGANTDNGQGVKDASITGGMVTTNSYKGSTPTGGLVSTDGGKTFTVYSDYTLSQDLTIATDGKLTVAEGTKLTIADGVTLTNNGVLVNNGTISGSAIKTGLTENRVTISGVPEGGFVFDGNAHEPTVKYNDVALVKGTDYTVIFSNSSGGDSITNVGTITMTIVGMGNYAGTVSKTYVIVKGNITPSVTLEGWKYGENAKTPVVTGNIGNGAVTYLYKVKGADDSTYTSTIPTNAGSYTVKAVIAESDNCYAAAATADFVIAQTEAKVETVPGAVDNLAYNGSAQTLIVAGTTNDGTMRYSLEENGPYLPELPKATAAGTYKVWYTVDGDANHTDGEVAYIEVTISKADPGIGTVTAGVIKDSVEVSAIVLTRANTTVKGTLSVNAGQTLKLGNNQITYTFTPSDTANYKIVTGTVTVTVADTIAPTGKVTVSNKSWTEFLNTITFGLFFKETQTVTVEATDNFSGVAKIEYYESTDALGLDAVKALASEKWTEMDNGKVTVTAVNAKQFIYYIRITDKSGNIAYLATNGAEFDTSAPVIGGVDDGVTYYTTQTVTVTDKNLNTVTLNGKAVTGAIALEGNKEATYTIVATDKVGNSTTVTVKIAPISDIAQSVEGKTDTNVTSDDKANLQSIVDTATELLKSEDLTPTEKTALEKVKADAEELLDAIEDAANATDTDNTSKVENVTSESVTPEDKTDLEKAKTDLEKALEANGGNYTEAEKKAIEDEIKRIDDALKVVENVETVETAISKLPATVEPDDEENVVKIEAAKKAYDALSAYEKSLVGKQIKETLDKLAAAAVAYDIIKGDGSEWTQGAEDSITFTANGLFSKFSGVKVDGQIVDAKHYEAKAGSTIITLKASYLETLTVGEHTIAVVYTDGETAGTFEIEAKSVTPETGDHSNVVLWSTALLISVLAAAVLVIGRKRFV